MLPNRFTERTVLLYRLAQWLSRILKCWRGEPVRLDIGVLIIGSLLWDEKRRAWRDARLEMGSAQAVTVPIRYGRLSASRGSTYTMVFSRRCEPGQGIVVRCTRGVSTSEDLVAEAAALWKAEQPSAGADRIGSNWGCIALLCNPDRRIPEEIVKAWGERVGREPGYGQVSQAHEEGRLVAAGGILQIPWPRVVSGSEPVQLDLLLATANDPTIAGDPGIYPTVEMVANAWNRAGGRYAEYFWRNTENGIRTFHDDEIRGRLDPRKQ